MRKAAQKKMELRKDQKRKIMHGGKGDHQGERGWQQGTEGGEGEEGYQGWEEQGRMFKVKPGARSEGRI